jgi:hypothetical protein
MVAMFRAVRCLVDEMGAKAAALVARRAAER